MHTRKSLLHGLGWFVLANALLFELITAWFWRGVIEPAADAPAAVYRVLNTFVHWPLLALIMVGLPTALSIVLLPRRPALKWAPWIVAALSGGIAACVMILDAVVFSQYRMHLGPYVWGLVAGGAGGETFLVFSRKLPFLLGAGALLIVAAEGALFALCLRLAEGRLRPLARPVWITWMALLVGANAWYAWADAHYQVNITQESGQFPFYRPITAKRVFRKFGSDRLRAATGAAQRQQPRAVLPEPAASVRTAAKGRTSC
jgi:membrane-anchored protein YejM (alkaline phosphatase superfamily)